MVRIKFYHFGSMFVFLSRLYADVTCGQKDCVERYSFHIVIYIITTKKYHEISRQIFKTIITHPYWLVCVFKWSINTVIPSYLWTRLSYTFQNITLLVSSCIFAQDFQCPIHSWVYEHWSQPFQYIQKLREDTFIFTWFLILFFF